MTFAEYYQALSSVSNWISQPLGTLSNQLDLAVASALILGLIGSASPCQLSTNVSAVAFFSRRFQDGWHIFGSALLYALGKAVVYTALAALAIGLGLEINRIPTEIVVIFRRALGPMLLLMGILLLGWARLSMVVGQRWQSRLEGLARGSSRWGGFWLGIAFSLAFCPTLFFLFFGLVVPLSASSNVGIALPSMFALGTTLPLHFLVLVLAISSRPLREWVTKVRWAEQWLRRGAGVLFLAMGVNEILLYWVLG